MNTLFSIEPIYPPGFSYSPHFIGENEENELLQQLKTLELHNFSFQGYTANRKVASYGYDYSFTNRKLTKGKQIPSVFNDLLSKIAAHLSMKKEDFAELLVTEYPPGSVINWHRDAPPFDIIVGLSLGADCTFRLRPHLKEKQGRSAIIAIPLQRRSLYVIRDEARTDWQHSISPVKQTRYSITLRSLKK